MTIFLFKNIRNLKKISLNVFKNVQSFQYLKQTFKILWSRRDPFSKKYFFFKFQKNSNKKLSVSFKLLFLFPNRCIFIFEKDI